MDVIETLNNIYEPICRIKSEIQSELKKQNLNYTSGFYNNHSIKDSNGNWVTEYFPIPVITVEFLCDVGIDVNYIFIETKMERKEAIKFNYNSLLPYKFEVYGVDEYLLDFYNEGMDISEIGSRIEKSKEELVGINFTLSKEYSTDDMILLVKKLIIMNN